MHLGIKKRRGIESKNCFLLNILRLLIMTLDHLPSHFDDTHLRFCNVFGILGLLVGKERKLFFVRCFEST